MKLQSRRLTAAFIGVFYRHDTRLGIDEAYCSNLNAGGIFPALLGRYWRDAICVDAPVSSSNVARKAQVHRRSRCDVAIGMVAFNLVLRAKATCQRFIGCSDYF